MQYNTIVHFNTAVEICDSLCETVNGNPFHFTFKIMWTTDDHDWWNLKRRHLKSSYSIFIKLWTSFLKVWTRHTHHNLRRFNLRIKKSKKNDVYFYYKNGKNFDLKEPFLTVWIHTFLWCDHSTHKLKMQENRIKRQKIMRPNLTRAVLGFRGFRVSRFVMSCARIGWCCVTCCCVYNFVLTCEVVLG